MFMSQVLVRAMADERMMCVAKLVVHAASAYCRSANLSAVFEHHLCWCADPKSVSDSDAVGVPKFQEPMNKPMHVAVDHSVLVLRSMSVQIFCFIVAF